MKSDLAPIVRQIRNGEIGVIPTDTIYGLVGQAKNKEVIKKIYRIKKRRPKKPLIILIANLADLRKFSINLTAKERGLINQFWPGRVSIVFPVSSQCFNYLHRGTKSLAFRLPKTKWLKNLLQKTGPLVAPSANPEGRPPAQTITEAKNYFGQTIDFYLSTGRRITGQPSKLIKINKGSLSVLRG